MSCDLSVVIASQDAGEDITVRCLAALEAQRGQEKIEVIVVDNSRYGTPDRVRDFPGVRLIRVAEPALIPALWAAGARQATGSLVALTTAHCVPAPGWVREVMRHQASPYAAVGGAIENARPSSPGRWAVYFARYAAYMPPFSPGEAPQVPGDNAAYRRWVLDEYHDTIAQGFWEHEINERLRRDGHRLFLTPAMRVIQHAAPGVMAFCRQRLVHGRRFGAGRAAGAPFGRRVLRMLSSPLIPVVYLAKITRLVLARGGHTAQFVLAFPLLTLFILCWALGELSGYALGGVREVSTVSSR